MHRHRGVEHLDVDLDTSVALLVGDEDGDADDAGAHHAPRHPQRADARDGQHAEQHHRNGVVDEVERAVDEAFRRGVATLTGEFVEQRHGTVHQHHSADEGAVEGRHAASAAGRPAGQRDGQPEQGGRRRRVQSEQEELQVLHVAVGDARQQQREESRGEDGRHDEGTRHRLVVTDAGARQVYVQYGGEAAAYAVRQRVDEPDDEEVVVAEQRQQSDAKVESLRRRRQTRRERRARGEVDQRDDQQASGRHAADSHQRRDFLGDIARRCIRDFLHVAVQKRVADGGVGDGRRNDEWPEQEGHGGADSVGDGRHGRGGGALAGREPRRRDT